MALPSRYRDIAADISASTMNRLDDASLYLRERFTRYALLVMQWCAIMFHAAGTAWDMYYGFRYIYNAQLCHNFISLHKAEMARKLYKSIIHACLYFIYSPIYYFLIMGLLHISRIERWHIFIFIIIASYDIRLERVFCFTCICNCVQWCRSPSKVTI